MNRSGPVRMLPADEDADIRQLVHFKLTVPETPSTRPATGPQYGRRSRAMRPTWWCSTCRCLTCQAWTCSDGFVRPTTRSRWCCSAPKPAIATSMPASPSARSTRSAQVRCFTASPTLPPYTSCTGPKANVPTTRQRRAYQLGHSEQRPAPQCAAQHPGRRPVTCAHRRPGTCGTWMRRRPAPICGDPGRAHGAATNDRGQHARRVVTRCALVVSGLADFNGAPWAGRWMEATVNVTVRASRSAHPPCTATTNGVSGGRPREGTHRIRRPSGRDRDPPQGNQRNRSFRLRRARLSEDCRFGFGMAYSPRTRHGTGGCPRSVGAVFRGRWVQRGLPRRRLRSVYLPFICCSRSRRVGTLAFGARARHGHQGRGLAQ